VANEEPYIDWMNRPQEASSCILQLEGHAGPVYCIAMHGNTLVSGSRDGQLRVWDLQSGRVTRVTKAHAFAINALVLVADGSDTTIITASDDGVISYHDLQTLRQQKELVADLG
jgi:WD40 repeat protein